MSIPTLTVSLSGPQAASTVFPTLAKRVMPGGWTRCFARLGKLGARFYYNERLPGVFECVAWPANAHAGVGVIDWAKLSIAAPTGWTMAMYPRHATLIRANALEVGDGSMQCFPTRRGFIVRFVLAAPGKVADLGLLNAPWASIPDPVTNFGPLGQTQPKVDRSKYVPFATNSLAQIRSSLAQGVQWSPTMPGLDEECGLMHPALGVWQPLGPATPGNLGDDNPAGSDIRFLPGYDQTVPGAVLERTRMDQVIERSLHAWDPITGDYLTVESYGDPSPQYSSSRESGQSDSELPGFIAPGVGASSCAYRKALEGFGEYGAAHAERAINPATVAHEYLHDPVAADFIVDLAEEFRLQFSDSGPVNTGEGWQPRNLKNYLALAKQKPEHGGDCGRYRAVPAWIVAMANKVKPRTDYKRWASMWCHWADLCQMRNGLWQWSTDNSFGLPPGIAGAQMFEQIYFALARVACGKMIGEHQPGAPILRAVNAMFVNRRLPRQPDPWHTPPAPVQYGSYHFIFVGANGVPFPVVSGGKGNGEGVGKGDPTNVDCALALASVVSGGAQKYEDALLIYGWPAATVEAKLAAYENGLDHNWDAAAMQLLQAEHAQQAPGER